MGALTSAVVNLSNVCQNVCIAPIRFYILQKVCLYGQVRVGRSLPDARRGPGRRDALRRWRGRGISSEEVVPVRPLRPHGGARRRGVGGGGRAVGRVVRVVHVLQGVREGSADKVQYIFNTNSNVPLDLDTIYLQDTHFISCKYPLLHGHMKGTNKQFRNFLLILG